MTIEQINIDHDQLFKKLFDTFSLEFIQLFLPQLLDYIKPGSLRPADKEAFSKLLQEIGERTIADVLIEATFKDRDASFLIHVENQSSTQTNFGERMFWYWVRLRERYKHEVYPIVVFSHDTPTTKEPNVYIVSFPDIEINRFQYSVVQLNQLRWSDYLNHPNPVASALMSKMQVAPQDRLKVKLECIKMLLSLKLNRSKTGFVATFVDSYLELNPQEEQAFDAELEKIVTRPERKKYMEIMSGRQQRALRQGLEQGLELGRRDGEADLMLEQLTYRFGKLRATSTKQIKSLTEPQLKELAKALFGFTNTDDLVAWLGQNVQA